MYSRITPKAFASKWTRPPSARYGAADRIFKVRGALRSCFLQTHLSLESSRQYTAVRVQYSQLIDDKAFLFRRLLEPGVFR
jgi:hypothetical protein